MALPSTDPLVGRARELERLRSLLDVIVGGSAATAVIEGEAGIGKTRLLGSLIAGARERGVAAEDSTASRQALV